MDTADGCIGGIRRATPGAGGSPPRASLPARLAALPEDDPARTLRRGGPASLSDSQLLALLLAPRGDPGVREQAVASNLACRFGHPSRLDRASLRQLMQVRGVGRHHAQRIKAAMELGRRSLSPPAERPKLANSRDVAGWFGPRIGNREVEVFCCALLDTRNRLLGEVTVATGTVNACFIHPREVFRAAVTESACAVILAHNHPSGELRPSEEDVNLTGRVTEAGKLLGIRVLDHVIVGPGGHFSFLDAGLLAT